MANFKPLKKYMIYLIDKLVEKHALSGPFLDVGCGKGDISMYFIKKGWKGKAIDLSEEAVVATKITLSQYMDRVTVEQEDVSNVKGEYKTIFLCDVLEHAVNAEELLENIKNIFNGRETGYLVLSVPIFQEEQRWDDRFYGHIKRYEIPEIITLLTRKGFEVLDIWDFTFPVFWLLRRIYTWVFPEKMIFNKSREALSSTSSLQNSWDMGILTAIFERIIWWRPIFYLQSKFKKRLIGCECLLVAKFIG